jgi:predicted transposase/invertase (TIGR01784 family)
MERTIISFDYAIKNILRDKANFDVLSGFLSELLNKEVCVEEILESESNKDDSSLKTNRVDLKAKIDNGEIAIFEIQFATQVDFFGKMLFDVSKTIVEQIPRSGRYDIKKVYMISIAYFNLGAKQDYLFTAKVSGFKGVNFNEIIPFSQTYGLTPPENIKTDIHPEYYLILPDMFDEQIRNKFDEWIYALKNSVIKSEFTAKGIQEAGEKLEELKMPPEERKIYEEFRRNRIDDNTVIDTARMEGKEEGKAEANTENAKKMKALKIPVAQISEITGLSLQEIEKL